MERSETYDEKRPACRMRESSECTQRGRKDSYRKKTSCTVMSICSTRRVLISYTPFNNVWWYSTVVTSVWGIQIERAYNQMHTQTSKFKTACLTVIMILKGCWSRTVIDHAPRILPEQAFIYRTHLLLSLQKMSNSTCLSNLVYSDTASGHDSGWKRTIQAALLPLMLSEWSQPLLCIIVSLSWWFLQFCTRIV